MKIRTLAPIVALVALALTGCAGPVGTGTGEPEILRGNWVLAEASDAAGSFDLGAAPVTLQFGRTTGGTAACNGYGTEITGGPGEITVGPIMQTEMACEADVMKLEFRYVTALGAATRAEYEGDELVLTGPDVELRFEPGPDSTATPEPSGDPDKPVTGCGDLEGTTSSPEPGYVCPQWAHVAEARSLQKHAP